MKFLKDIKQAFQEGYPHADSRNMFQSALFHVACATNASIPCLPDTFFLQY